MGLQSWSETTLVAKAGGQSESGITYAHAGRISMQYLQSNIEPSYIQLDVFVTVHCATPK